MFEAILREVSIGVNFIEVALLVEIFFYYINYYNRQDFEDTKKDPFLLSTSFSFLGFGLARIFYILYDYYIGQQLLVVFAWIFLLVSIVLLFLGVFKGPLGAVFKEFPHKVFYVISIFVLIVIGAIFRLLVNVLYIMPIFFAAGIGILIPPIWAFNKWIQQVGGSLSKLKYSLLAIPLCFLGLIMGPTWTAIGQIGLIDIAWTVKIISHILFLSGLIFFSMSMFGLPTFDEILWEKTLQNIYVLMPNGTCVYNYSFEEGKALDADLLAGGLTGIIDIVQEMTQSDKKLKIIRQESSNLFLEYGTMINVVMIAEKDLQIIYDKIHQFRVEFESHFNDVLKQFDGNVDVFKKSEIIIKKVFPTIVK